jgi:hypothetical protein
MSDGIQEHDIIVVKSEYAFSVVQVLRGEFRHLEGPYTQVKAESRALALAKEHDSDAWIQRGPDIYTLLSD